MSALKPASWSYAEEFVPEPEVVEAARRRGVEFGDASPVGTGAGAALRFVAAAVQARHVVEVGTGAGTSGLWLLAGMPEDGVLTTIDSSAEHQRAAREAYAEAGYAHQRTRVITGAAADVLPRMTDGAYDLVVVDADKDGYPIYVEHAVRLLRSGGVLVHRQHALARPGRRPGGARRDDEHPARPRQDAARPRRARPGAAAGQRRPARRRQALSRLS